MQTGKEPDWFHDIQFQSQLTIEVHDRYPLNGILVQDFLRKNELYLYRMEFRIANKLKRPLSTYTFPHPSREQIEFQKELPKVFPPLVSSRSSRLLPGLPSKNYISLFSNICMTSLIA